MLVVSQRDVSQGFKRSASADFREDGGIRSEDGVRAEVTVV
jgi:hypothetical protein